jgi:hypothetical protein
MSGIVVFCGLVLGTFPLGGTTAAICWCVCGETDLLCKSYARRHGGGEKVVQIALGFIALLQVSHHVQS